MVYVSTLLWDEWNMEHINRHAVSAEEVAEVCYSESHFAVRGSGGKLAVYGQTEAGRYLLVVLASRRHGSFYPITAREMTSTERRRYLSRRG